MLGECQKSREGMAVKTKGGSTETSEALADLPDLMLPISVAMVNNGRALD